MMENYHSKIQDLQEMGFTTISLSLPPKVQTWVANKDWVHLDNFFGKIVSNEPPGLLFQELKKFGKFQSVEHMLALRSAPEDDEGIWHDDGSRVMAFSLSLNPNPKSIRGGELFIRKKGQADPPISTIGPLPWGELAIFLTGVHGFEHRVGKVRSGERLVIAGWCS